VKIAGLICWRNCKTPLITFVKKKIKPQEKCGMPPSLKLLASNIFNISLPLLRTHVFVTSVYLYIIIFEWENLQIESHKLRPLNSSNRRSRKSNFATKTRLERSNRFSLCAHHSPIINHKAARKCTFKCERT
jgi:hypothetical protein